MVLRDPHGDGALARTCVIKYCYLEVVVSGRGDQFACRYVA